jgi:hypothetical protein
MSEIRCILTVRQTEKAYLIRVAGRELWLPRSICKSITKFRPDMRGEREAIAEVEDWWLEKNDL